MSIRSRIFLAFVLMLALGVFGLTWWVQAGIKPRYLEAQEDPLVDLSQLLASLVSVQAIAPDPDRRQPRLDLGLLARVFEDLQQRRISAQIYSLLKDRVDIRVYVTDRGGRVLFDSDGGRDLGADYSQWRDVYLTLRGDYGARGTEGDPLFPEGTTMYIAAPILVEGEILGVVSVGKPTANAQRFIEDAVAKLLFGALLAALAAGLVGLFLHRWLTRPLQHITDYARAVRAGERVSLPELGRNEVGRVGTAMAEMRAALDGKSYVESYVQSLTHELKSPLAAIRGSAELLEEAMPAADRARFQEHIRTQVERMQELIQRLLDLAAIENLSGLKDSCDIPLGPLARQVIEGLQPLALQAGVHIESSIRGEPTLRGDAFLLRTAVHNLVKNAIECSPPGTTVRLSAVREADHVLIRVRDLGPGIPDYARDKVFDRFYTLPKPRGRTGSGLGLSFVKEIASLFRGSVSLTTPADGGTLAEIRLPRTPPKAPHR